MVVAGFLSGQDGLEQLGAGGGEFGAGGVFSQGGEVASPGGAGEAMGVCGQEREGGQGQVLLVKRLGLIQQGRGGVGQKPAEFVGGGFDFGPALQGEGELQPEGEAAFGGAGTGRELLEGEFRFAVIT